MLSTITEIFLYFLTTAFLLWLTSNPKQETSPAGKIETNKKSNFSKGIETIKSTVESGNLLSVRPIAPFCQIWARPLEYIQD